MKYKNNYKIKIVKNKNFNKLKIWKMLWLKQNNKEMMIKQEIIYLKRNKKCKNI